MTPQGRVEGEKKKKRKAKKETEKHLLIRRPLGCLRALLAARLRSLLHKKKHKLALVQYDVCRLNLHSIPEYVIEVHLAGKTSQVRLSGRVLPMQD